MKTPKHTNIIPISFVPGSGGRFLNYILNSTRSTTTIDTNIDLEHMFKLVVAFGNMKLQSQSMLVPVQEQLNDLLNYAIDSNSDITEYCGCHVLDVPILLNNFEKVIQITYEESDILDISFSFIAENIPDDLRMIVSATVNNNMKYISSFKTEGDNPSLLRISWKELYKEDITNIVEKLNNFLNLSTDTIKVDELLEWRNETHTNIQKVKTLLGDDIKKIVVWKKEGNTTYRNKLLALTKYNTGD